MTKEWGNWQDGAFTRLSTTRSARALAQHDVKRAEQLSNPSRSTVGLPILLFMCSCTEVTCFLLVRHGLIAGGVSQGSTRFLCRFPVALSGLPTWGYVSYGNCVLLSHPAPCLLARFDGGRARSGLRQPPGGRVKEVPQPRGRNDIPILRLSS